MSMTERLEQIQQAQHDLREALAPLEISSQAFRESGDIEDFHFAVYKLRQEPWCIKSAVPLTAKAMAAFATYLAALDQLNPIHVTDASRRGCGLVKGLG